MFSLVSSAPFRSSRTRDLFTCFSHSRMPRRELRPPGSRAERQLVAWCRVYQPGWFYLQRIWLKGTDPFSKIWQVSVPVLVTMGDSFDTTELAKAWDEIETIRNRLRDGKPLLTVQKSGTDSSIQECKANQDVLTPLLHRFFTSKLKLPDIGSLRHEIESLYLKANRTPSESEIDDDGWELRTMMRFVKRKANRGDFSKDSRQWYLNK